MKGLVGKNVKSYIGLAGLDVLGDTRVLRAVATVATGSAGLLRGVGGIEPQHVGIVLATIVNTSGRSTWQ